jgi:hypothetical protein
MAKFKDYYLKNTTNKITSLEMCTLVGESDAHSRLVAVNVLTCRDS